VLLDPERDLVRATGERVGCGARWALVVVRFTLPPLRGIVLGSMTKGDVTPDPS
jgi:hypothetical protein